MKRTKLSSAGLILAISALIVGVGSTGLALAKSNANVQETKATDLTEKSTYTTMIAVQTTDDDVNARIHIKTADNDWTTEAHEAKDTSVLNYKANILINSSAKVYAYYQFASNGNGYLSFLASQTNMTLTQWQNATITINAGCQFPSYAFAYSSGTTCYKQTYTATFIYAYTEGSLAYFKENFTTSDKSATVTSVLIQNLETKTKLINFRIPNADYTVQTGASDGMVSEKNYNIFNNTANEILLYSGANVISASIGHYRFRGDGDGSETLVAYLGTAVEAKGFTKIVVKAGAQFASYQSELNHATAGNAKCYELPYDVTLVYSSSPDGNDLFVPSYMAHTDNHINALKLDWMSGESETRLVLNLNVCDWDGKFAGYTSVGSAYTQYLDIASHILVDGTTPITFTNGTSSIESWFNLNVSGSWLVQNSFVMDVKGDISAATSITITAGLQIPMYSVTSGATIQNICYQTPADAVYKIYDTGTTKRYAEVKTAAAVMSEFTTYCNGVCGTYDGTTNNATNLAKYFTWLSTEYTVMSDTEKSNINTTNYANEITRYKYLVNKYTSLTDFLSLRASGGSANELGLATTVSNETWVIIGLSCGAAIALAIFLRARKRKEDRA